MKISGLYYCWMAPWRECEMCFLGPSMLYSGDDLRIGLGLFFIEFGIVLKRNEATIT